MNPRITAILLAVIVLATFITGIIVYPHLPALAISHWSANGTANGHMPRFWAAFLLPVMMALFSGLWALLPRIDPINKGFKGFRHVYDFFWILLIAFLAYVYALSLLANLGWWFNMLTYIMPAIGLFIFVLGACLPRVKRNWFFGIRTPWSLSSDQVWDKTHALGGKLFMLAGVIIFLTAFVSPARTLWIVLLSILVAAFISIVYSYFCYRAESPGR